MEGELRLLSRALEWREVEGEIVALNLDTSQYVAINRVGATLWSALVSGTTAQALTQHLVDQYAIDPTTAANDIANFLSSLHDQGLLER